METGRGVKTPDPFVRVVDGEPKIHRFEKHYIEICLKKEIQNVELEVSKLKEYTGPGIDPKPIARAVERFYLRDLRKVLERVEAMPTTSW